MKAGRRSKAFVPQEVSSNGSLSADGHFFGMPWIIPTRTNPFPFFLFPSSFFLFPLTSHRFFLPSHV